MNYYNIIEETMLDTQRFRKTGRIGYFVYTNGGTLVRWCLDRPSDAAKIDILSTMEPKLFKAVFYDKLH